MVAAVKGNIRKLGKEGAPQEPRRVDHQGTGRTAGEADRFAGDPGPTVAGGLAAPLPEWAGAEFALQAIRLGLKLAWPGARTNGPRQSPSI